MIKILVRTNFTEKTIIVDKETTLQKLMEDNNIRPNIAPPALQGITISSAHYDSTVEDIMNIYNLRGEALLLTTVVKTNNAV